jgi:hypothetical protein
MPVKYKAGVPLILPSAFELKDKFRNSVREINRLSESVEQRQTAKDIVKNFPQINFVGKTNKGNLVFENKNKQLKVSPNGQIL